MTKLNIEFKDILKSRMELLDITTKELADTVFMTTSEVKNILDGIVGYDDLDSFDISLLCSALYCSDDYFENKETRDKDMLNNLIATSDTLKIIEVKKRISSYLYNMGFIKSVDQKGR